MTDAGGVLKRHGFLIASIALPLLVVVGFVLARTLPRLWVADAAYDVLYLVRRGYDSQPRNIDRSVSVVAGRLRVRWTKLESQQYPQPMHVYRFHPASGSCDEVRLPEAPPANSFDRTTELDAGGFEGVSIDSNLRAPDGYAFDPGSGGNSGLMNELLVHRYRGPRAAISKSGRVIPLPRSDSEPYGYEPAEFLGWIVRAESAR